MEEDLRRASDGVRQSTWPGERRISTDTISPHMPKPPWARRPGRGRRPTRRAVTGVARGISG